MNTENLSHIGAHSYNDCKSGVQLINLRGLNPLPYEVKREPIDSLEGSFDGFLENLDASSNLSNDSRSEIDQDSLTIEGSPTPTISSDNHRSYEICGQTNRHSKPCQRIGRCPFHVPKDKSECKGPPLMLLQKKGTYKTGWTPEEHVRFLKGIQIHGKGAWKDIATIVGTRTSTQIQVHAHRYFLRQKQGTKNKRSIHDFSLNDLAELETKIMTNIPPSFNNVQENISTQYRPILHNYPRIIRPAPLLIAPHPSMPTPQCQPIHRSVHHLISLPKSLINIPSSPETHESIRLCDNFIDDGLYKYFLKEEK